MARKDLCKMYLRHLTPCFFKNASTSGSASTWRCAVAASLTARGSCSSGLLFLPRCSVVASLPEPVAGVRSRAPEPCPGVASRTRRGRCIARPLGAPAASVPAASGPAAGGPGCSTEAYSASARFSAARRSSFFRCAIRASALGAADSGVSAAPEEGACMKSSGFRSPRKPSGAPCQAGRGALGGACAGPPEAIGGVGPPPAPLSARAESSVADRCAVAGGIRLCLWRFLSRLSSSCSFCMACCSFTWA
mmetsp:Transcript_39843/g.72187  ORF Transcript_39843/g.72187 Transcript_39843/m.72187 type:complete len:249 (-) Transcript_39843:518-1264(-)